MNIDHLITINIILIVLLKILLLQFVDEACLQFLFFSLSADIRYSTCFVWAVFRVVKLVLSQNYS